MVKHSVFVEAKAQKQFGKLPKDVQERVLEVPKHIEKEGLSARMDREHLLASELGRY